MLDSIAVHIIDSWLSKTTERPLYHYTSQAGFVGIVQTKTIWATKLQYLSDAAEFAYAIDLFRSELLALREETRSENAKRILDMISERLKGIASINIFVSSFSENGNLLSQWRAYCPSGSGFSLGFDPQDLQVPAREQPFFLAACTYDPLQQRAFLKQLLSDTLGAIEKQGGKEEQRVEDLIWSFYGLGPLLKNPAFREESEWRIVSNPMPSTHPQIKSRIGLSMLVPYFEFHLTRNGEPLKLADVYVGPTPHMTLSIQSAADFLSKNAVKNRGVTNCLIPYRTW